MRKNPQLQEILIMPEPAHLSTSVDVIRRLHEHRLWSRSRLIEAASSLSVEQWLRPFEIGRGTLWATVEHLYGAERVWIAALQGQPDEKLPDGRSVVDLSALLEAWRSVDERWRGYLDALTPAMLAMPVQRYSALWQRSYTTHAVDVLLHVVTHAAYTTAQAMNMLRHLGVGPLQAVDLILMSREQWDEPGAS